MFHVLTLTYTQPADVVDMARAAHVEWIEREIAAGRLILAGRLDTETGGVLVTGDIDVDSAEQLIAEDPYSTADLVTYERVSFEARLRAPGL
jgi:uncharacterized protein